MVERRIELGRQRRRRKKLLKLKPKLAEAKSPHEKELILNKILRVSPWWQEPQGQ